LALEQPDLSRASTGNVKLFNFPHQVGALSLLDTAGGDIGLGVRQPQMRPAELQERVLSDPICGFSHKSATLKFGRDPEAPLIVRTIIWPKIYQADGIVRRFLEADCPKEALTLSALLQALPNVHLGTIRRIRPRHVPIEPADDLPMREMELKRRRIFKPKRTQYQA
jgi:hypothetical protein